MRRLLSLLVLTLAIAGIGSARKIHIIADIAGDGSAHQFLTTITRVSFWQVQAMPGNSATTCGSSSVAGCPRIGDSTVSTGTGVWLIPGSSQFSPPTAVNNGNIPFEPTYDLSTFYYLVQSGDKITIAYWD